MAARVRVQPVSRVGLAPLVEMAEQLRLALPGWDDARVSSARPTVSSDLASDLSHLALHDGDGFQVASLGDEVLGFATSFVRSRRLIVSNLWLFPGETVGTAAEALLRRAVNFGERAGVQDYAANVLGAAELQAACFPFDMRPRFPIYRLTMPAPAAKRAGQELAKLLPGLEITEDMLERRAGAADFERIDRLVRSLARPMDHEYWLAQRRLRTAVVRAGQRIAAYAYGGAGQCGPVAGLTGEAALAALGWALQLAAQENEEVELLVPATFETGLEHLLAAGAVCRAAAQWMSRGTPGGMDRCILASTSLL